MSAGRPPLPEGPYLVVGLARSGLAAARMLEPHGRVIACDSGTPDVPAGLEAHLGTDGVELLDRVRCVVKSPGVPREAPVVAAALERGLPVHGELELAWRLLPNRFVAVTGTNGKTTTVELLGRGLPGRGHAGGGGGQRGHAAVQPRGRARARRRGGVRGLELPARGRERLRPGHRPPPEPGGGPPGPPRDLRALSRRQAAGLRAPGARRRGRGSSRPHRARRRPEGDLRPRRGGHGGGGGDHHLGGRAAHGHLRSPPAGRAQPGERPGSGRGGPGLRGAGGGGAPGPDARSPGWSTGWRRWARWAACCS